MAKRVKPTTVTCPCCGVQPIKITTRVSEYRFDFGQVYESRACGNCGKSEEQCNRYYFIKTR